MTETTTHNKIRFVDEFLERHGHTLPGHVIDFALDVRSLLTELENLEEEERQPEPVA